MAHVQSVLPPCPVCDGPLVRRTTENTANFDDVKDDPTWADFLSNTRIHGGPVVCFHCDDVRGPDPGPFFAGMWAPTDGDGFIFTPYTETD